MPRRGGRPPGLVVIGHLTYALRLDQVAIDAKGQADGCRYAGWSSSMSQEIVLAEDLGWDYERDTVLHEVLHQCLDASGYDPDGDAAAGVKDVEERTVKAASGPLLSVLRANPALVRYLTRPAP